MLIDFSVSNYRSIRERQSLNLYRSSRSAREAAAADWRRPDLASVAVIFGANAAGKSSLIDAIHFLAEAVEESYSTWKPRGGVEGREPFRLDRSHSDLPTELDVEFVAGDGLEYRYGFAVDDERVVSEYLHVFRTARRSVLFEREGSKYKFGDSFRGPASLLRETTRSNSLFLSAAAAAGLEATEAAHSWITESLRVYAATGYRVEHSRIKHALANNPRYKADLAAFMRAADLGVASLDVSRQQLEGEERERLRSLVESGDVTGSFEEIVQSLEMEISLTHKGDGMESEIPFHLESDGTQALLSFASVTMRALKDGSVCVVDEIDTSLHPALVRELVMLFADSRINQRQAQLIFTSHDVSLLAPGTPLERESVWLVEKSPVGASTLFSLAEYGMPRKEENLERGYLTGRYGGIPRLSIAAVLLAAQAQQG